MAIAGGELPVGAMLPSVRGLAQQFAVNPKTVAKAYDEFANEGWLNARPGLGLLVAERQQRRSDSERERRLDIALDTFSAEVIGLGYPLEQVLDQVRTKLSPILGKRTAGKRCDGPRRGGATMAGADIQEVRRRPGAPPWHLSRSVARA